MRGSFNRLFKCVFAFGVVGLLSDTASAHVKWFSAHAFENPPVSFASLNHLAFWALLALTVVTIAGFVYCDKLLWKWDLYRKSNDRLESYAPNATLILRIFTGASLLLAWQVDSMIAPELRIAHAAAGWFQFALCLLLLGRRTSPLAGLGMIALYFYAMTQYGFFHLLDYVVYPAIGYFLFVSEFRSQRVHATRVPALYIGLGFSLLWAALEKVFFPTWGLEVLAQHPALTMGLEPKFFLLACAFVELSLGYLLIIGLLQRPLALIITLTFFTTTAFFGKTEIVGHTILHGALLVFVVLGPGGYYPPPIDFHKKDGLRALFAAVNFVIIVGLLAIPYRSLSDSKFEEAKDRAHAQPLIQEQHHDHQHDHAH